MDQVNESVNKTINDFFIKHMETPVDFMVTLSRVETSPNLRYSKVYISVLPDNKRGSALRLVRKHAARLQGYLKGQLHMKYIPKVEFVIDGNEIYANEIEKLLAEIHKEEKNNEQ
jgi:ribosome-binding factor A